VRLAHSRKTQMHSNRVHKNAKALYTRATVFDAYR
jgi:hypothetical protein